MKYLVILGFLVACVHGGVVSKIAEKLSAALVTDFVIRGEEAAPHSAPYAVSLSLNTTKHSHNCGGTIISKEWIVTAAHCQPAVGMAALAGVHNQLDLEGTQDRRVDFVKCHENYTGGIGPYDIAVLHVSQPFEFNERVQAALLPSRNEHHTGTCHLYGWGQTKAFVFSTSATLQTLETQLLPNEECKAQFAEDTPLYESNLCTDSLNQKVSACNGDSGGPLVIEREGVPAEFVGIVSWGSIPCAVFNKPSVYTRVSHYIDWLLNAQLDLYRTL